MIIDAHRHFWRYNESEFGWIHEPSLKRNFLPADAIGMDSCIAIEARQSVEETEMLLDFAAIDSSILGVVGWLPLGDNRFPALLEPYLSRPRLVGLRHVIQDEPNPAFMLRPGFLDGVRATLAAGLAYDILVFEEQLPNTLKFIDSLPSDARLVLDHIGKPRSAKWFDLIREVAKRENVVCKVSGVVTEVGREVERYLAAVAESFGPGRLMFGSDWPVLAAYADYDWWREKVANYFSTAERDLVMSQNARKFYLKEQS